MTADGVHPQVRLVVRPYASALPLGFFAYFLIAFAIVVLALGASSVLGKPLIAAILLLAALRSSGSAVYELGGGRGFERASGWIALAIFVVSLYGGLAFMLEDARGESVLPIGRTGASREALEGDLATQLRRLDSEAGIRQTL